MVGVPGRSKSCSTCRARRKRCDRRQPSCGQCARGDLVCGGYTREHVWVNARQTRHRVNATYSTVEKPALHVVAGSSHIALHDSLAQSAREQKYVGLFWDAYLPNGRRIDKVTSALSAGGWMAYIDTLYDIEPSLRYALLAMSSSMLGTQDNDEQLRVKGLQTYIIGVREMANALNDKNRATSDALLAAVRMMGSYEVLFGCDAQDYSEQIEASQSHIDGWLGHTQGELSLMKLRGPAAFISGPGHQLLADGRMNAVADGISRRERTVFAREEWKTTPWRGRDKTLKDKLLDIAVDLPSHLEDADALSTCSDTKVRETSLRELVERCRESSSALLAWEAEAGSKVRKWDYTMTGLPVAPLERYEDLPMLHLASFYWAMSNLLCSLISSLLSQEELPLATGKPSGKGNEDDVSYWKLKANVFARKITHSVHLFFEPQSGGLGANLGILPLCVALFFFEKTCAEGRQSSELSLLQGLFGRSFLGTCVGRFLRNLGNKIRREPGFR